MEPFFYVEEFGLHSPVKTLTLFLVYKKNKLLIKNKIFTV